MDRVIDLPDKLDGALKFLSLSRVALAQQLGVDKSLVGRWLSGAVHPTEHNLARLSGLIGDRVPSFRLSHWYNSTESFLRAIGLEAPPSAGSVVGPWAEFLEVSRPELAFRGAAYEGFWRTSRPSVLQPDRVFHDYGLIRQLPGGMIEVRMRGSGLDFAGQMIPSGSNVFVFLFDRTGRTPMTVLFKGVSLPKAMTLDGILLLAALDPNRTPAAVPLVIERVANLIGDPAQDDARFEEMAQSLPAPIAPVEEAALKARLFRDVGPKAAAEGGEMFLAVQSSCSLSRGVAEGGLAG